MTTGSRTCTLACLVVATLGLALRLSIACRDIDVIDRLFIPDDTYYTLSIARSLAQGIGPSVDGVTLTNGFQPLLAFLQVPFFWILADPDTIVRATLFLLCFLDAGLALLLGRLAARAAGGLAGALTTALWSFSPQAIELCLGGLETTLALLCIAAMVATWISHRDRASHRSAILLGLTIGLALLARIDAAFLVLIIGLWELARGDRTKLILVVATSLAVVAPWWIYSQYMFGFFLPESGAAVRQIAYIYQGKSVVLRSPCWAMGTILGGPFVDLPILRQLMYNHTAPGILVAAAVSLGFGGLTTQALHRIPPPMRIPCTALAVHACLIAAFYMFYVPAIWFYHRYLSISWVGLSLIAGILAARMLVRHTGTRLHTASRVAVTLLWLVPLVQSSGYLTHSGTLSHVWAIDGPTGYRAPMRAALRQAPPTAVIGSFQTGALSYYANGATRIVNLDGVVNSDAFHALTTNRIDEYAREQGVTHFCDWRVQHGLFRARSSGDPEFNVIGVARQWQQADNRVYLSEIIYHQD